MTLGYFLSAFLGIKWLAFGDIAGKIGTDWWPIEMEHLDDEIKKRGPGGVELLEFKDMRKDMGNSFEFYHPRFIGGAEDCLNLIRGVCGRDGRIRVQVLKNGQRISDQAVEELQMAAIKTLRGGQ